MTTYAERRSTASRWVRYWTRHGKLAAALMIFGWTLMALAEGSTPQGDAAFETMKLLAGGGLLAFGMVAGVTKWIVEPAVLRGVSKHRDEVNAHAAYLTRAEWDLKHSEMAKKLDDSHSAILSAIANLRRSARGHE